MTTPHLGNKIIILSNQVKHCLHQASEVEGISGAQGRILHKLNPFAFVGGNPLPLGGGRSLVNL